MYFKIEDRMAKELKISGNELLIYGVIYSSQNQTYVWGQSYLTEITGMSIATIKRCLKGMVKSGLIVKVSKGYQIVSKGAIQEETEKYQNDTSMAQNDTKKVSKGATYNNTTNTIIIKEEKKESENSVSNLVKEFEKDDRLLRLYGGTEVVREWLNYKQSKKDRAYKTTKGFLQQMNVIIKDIQFGQPRGDLTKRFEFAVNQAMENERKGIYRDDKIEQKYQGFKSMTRKDE